MQLNKNEAIEIILNEWFKLVVIKGDEITFKYKIHNDKMRKQCHALRNIHFRNKHIQTFVVDYILEIFLAMKCFTATDLEWRAMAEMTDTSRLNELELYVRAYAQYEIKRSKLELQGKIMSINNKEELVTLPTLSLDFVGESDNNEVNMLNFLTSEDNIFSNNVNQIYYETSFRKWFDEHRESILTKNQNEFVTNMNKVNMIEHDNETVRSLVGIDKCKVNTKLDKIAERVVKAYNKQLPRIKSREQLELEQRISLLQPIVSIVYDDDLDNVNDKIFEYVAEHFGELQEYLHLSADECIAINRNEYSSKIVYKLVDQLETKLDEFKARVTKSKTIETNEIDTHEQFVHVKKEHENSEMEFYFIAGKDGLMIKQVADEFDKPKSSEVRVYKMR